MELTSLAIAVAIIIVIFLIMHFVMKTLKTVAAVIIIVVVLGVWFYGFSGFFDKVSSIKGNIPELEMQRIAKSITGCTEDIECSYVIESGDCRMFKDYCNNVLKEDNYKRVVEGEVLEEECNRTSVQVDFAIDCECKLHREQEGSIKQWIGKKIEEKAGYTYCWKKD